MGQLKSLGRSTSENIHLHSGIVQNEEKEEKEILRGESGGLSSPTPLQDDSSLDDAEVKNDFWSITSDFIYCHHVDLRVKLYVPREESFPIPMKYIDVTRNTHTSPDVMMEKILMITGTWMEKENFQMTPHLMIQENKRLQDPKNCGQKRGNTCQMHPNVRKSKNGPSRNQNSITSEVYVVLTSLIQG